MMTPRGKNADTAESPLSIDLGCPLFIQCKGQKERFRSRLVGRVPGAYLIAATPNVPGIRNLLGKFDSIMVRYIHQGEVFGFQTVVIGAIASPFKLTFIACPARVERINLRQSARIDCHVPATLTAGDRSVPGMILDISTAGCRFSARIKTDGEVPPISVGRAVGLSFPLLGEQGSAELHGMVKNAQQDKDRMVLGIYFSDLDPKMADRIAAYVEEVSGYL
jgi:PilZ domain/Flagellar protein YcgR